MSVLTQSLPGSAVPRFRFPPLGLASIAAAIGLFLLAFLVLPVTMVIFVAFTEPATGALTLNNFLDFFRSALFREAFVNSFYVSGMSVVLATIFALPLAYLTSRFEFRGAVLIQTLGFIPLIMPPFIGAVAMMLLFGENGSINLILGETVICRLARDQAVVLMSEAS